MNKHLILVKHSLPEIVQGRPANEWHLSEDGRQRAQQLAVELRAHHPEVLFSSLEPKARETAEIVSKELDLELRTAENLHEHDRSGVPFLSGEDFQHAVREFFRRPGELVFGSETADQAHDRFSEALHSILETYKHETIVVVAHGTVISLFVSRLTGTSDLSLWSKLGLPSYVVLDRDSKTLIAQENIL